MYKELEIEIEIEINRQLEKSLHEVIATFQLRWEVEDAEKLIHF